MTEPTVQDAELVQEALDQGSMPALGPGRNPYTALSRILAENKRLAERAEKAEQLYRIGTFLAEGDDDSALEAAHRRIHALEQEVERLREKLAGYEGLGRSVPRIRQALSPTEEPR